MRPVSEKLFMLWLSAAVVMVTAEWWIHGSPVGNPTMDPIGKAL
jgi:hypothetical protein